MAATSGQLDPQGSPLVPISVFPEGKPRRAKRFDALIDTGFTGFAVMPMEAAVKIGLNRNHVIMDLTYADGRTFPTPAVFASVQLGTEIREGFVFLLPGADGDVAVGVHFLRVFKKTLEYSVTGNRVELSD